ncbi:MAG: acyl-CoA dehydrogenase family protein [Gammaproteobacteria bacterium]
MSDTQIITDTLARIFDETLDRKARLAAESGTFARAAWQSLAETGMLHPAVPDALGGAGGTLADEYEVLVATGRAGAPLPIADTILAGWLLSTAGREVPAGPLAAVAAGAGLRAVRRGDTLVLEGRARRVPWGRDLAGLVVLAEDAGRTQVALVPMPAGRVENGANLAGEPRDTLVFEGAAVSAVPADLPPGVDAGALRRRGALGRAALMAGAMETAVDLAVRYANDRVQFGKPIGKQQSVQHALAILAVEAAAGAMAAARAYRAVADAAADADLHCAVAKSRAGEAAGRAAGIAHQVHGAIGFTREHTLHFVTRRLWSWREEYGNESAWTLEIGRLACAAGGPGLWPMLAG